MAATTATQTPTTPLGREATMQVWNTLEAYSTKPQGFQATASRADTDRLRLRLAEYEAQHASMADVVLLLRRFFNTYRVNGWRITGWMVAAALRLLATVADALEADARDEQEYAGRHGM